MKAWWMCAALLGASCTTIRRPLDLYVGPHGNDKWSGRSAAAKAGHEGPFASLERARDEVRRLKAAGALPYGVKVQIKGGTYSLSQPLVFTPADSGSVGAPVVYCPYKGESVSLVGSRPLSGWHRLAGGGIWECRLPKGWQQTFRFRQVFYDGTRLTLARVPNRDPKHPRSGGFLYVDGVVKPGSKTLLKYNPACLDPSGWAEPTKARVTIWPWLNWNSNTIPIKHIDLKNHVIELASPASYKLIRGNRFFIDNVREELDAPGEWYLDRDRGVLLLIPPDGKDPEGHVTADCLDNLIELEGNAKAEVQYITLRRFSLSQDAGTLVRMSRTASCQLIGCVLTDCGGTAVTLDKGSSYNRIAGCNIAHCGGMAIELNGVRDWTHTLKGRISYNVITNNYIHNVGECGNAWAAVRISPACGGNVTHDNVISHNLIHDTPRQGISFNGFHNIVEYNVVHHTNQEQSDTGAIGMGSRDIHERGSIIRYNYVHDTGGYSMVRPGVWEYPHFCWGIYLDDYTSGVQVYGNLCVRTYLGGVMVHGGQDNVIENNVVVDGFAHQLQLQPIDSLVSGRTKGDPDTRMWLMKGTRILHNIFYYDGKHADWIHGAKWKQILAAADYNLIWPKGGQVKINLPGTTPEGSWKAWQRLGYGAHSEIADPLFVNPAKDNYRLRSNSPAFALGFKPIPFDKIGLYKSDERATWPVVDNCLRPTHLTRPGGLSVPPPGRVGHGAAPVFNCPRTAKPPVLDGRVTPGEWPGKGERVVALSMGDGPGKEPSTAFACHDRKALYVAVVNQVSDVARLNLKGGTWGADDGVEICIQVCPDKGNPGPVYVVQGYPSGICNSVTNAGASGAAAAALGKTVQYKAGVHGNAWTGEWRSPLAALGLTAGSKATVLFNIGVLKAAERQWIAWVSTGGAPWHMQLAGKLALK